jgi:hypothetical protein
MIKVCKRGKVKTKQRKITNLILNFDDVVGWFEYRSFDNEESDLDSVKSESRLAIGEMQQFMYRL